MLSNFRNWLVDLLDKDSKRRRRAEELIFDFLPDEMAEELLLGQRPKAKHYSSVTIVFTDIKNFTQIAETYRPQELVEILNKYYSKFDEVSAKYKVERVKTIGDSYMGVAGCPVRRKDHPVRALLAALEIQRWILELETTFRSKNEDFIELKIGINTGEAVAGIIGKFRHAFDVWGDTVNVAFRMQESCEAGKINITEHTYKHIAPFFEVEERGLINTKRKGPVSMYYVNGIKRGLRDKNQLPNRKFWEHVSMKFYGKFKFFDMERDMYTYLEEHLPNNLHYHGLQHTKYVAEAAEKIALKEGVRGEELFIVKTAAIFHDAGFIWEYKNNEQLGANLAKEILPKYGYTEDQIKQVCGLILATRVPQDPSNKLEQILCDADLYYLGNPKFHKVADSLYLELKERGELEDKRQWDKIQVWFLTEHYYHTAYAKKKALPGKERHLEEIKKRLEDNAYPANTPL